MQRPPLLHLRLFYSALLLPALLLVFVMYGLWPPELASSAPQSSGSAEQRPLTATASVSASMPITLFAPLITTPPPANVIIAAAYIDSALSGEPDEAILLWNIGHRAQPLAGWRLKTASKQATFPVDTDLALSPGQRLWCTAQADAFSTSFGEEPACAWEDAGASAATLLEGDLALANTGGFIQLFDHDGQAVDILVYGNESQPMSGWQGAPVQPFDRGSMPSAGQVLTRKQAAATAWPVDSDRVEDWSSDMTDLDWGRRVRKAGWRGWEQDDLFAPVTSQTHARITVAVGPEGLFSPLADLLKQATASLDLSIYTLEHPELCPILADAVRRGVALRILLEGSPPGGIDDLQKWCTAQIVDAGGQVRYMATVEDAPNGTKTRFQFSHAKYGVIDGWLAFNGTENFNTNSMPTQTNPPPGGRRGFYLITDAGPVVSALQQIFDADWAPDRFLDLHPFEHGHPKYGGPPSDFVLPLPSEYPVADAPFAQPLTVHGMSHFQVVSAPENALRPDAGLHGLLGRAGAGDEIRLVQLYENKNWGATSSNPIADPNPRLHMIFDAARRGARVRLLLDSFFDDPEALRSNRATVEYVREVAGQEGIDIQARLGNPTGGGIHAKLALIRIGGEHWSGIGSLNGGEVSYKLNREVVVLTDRLEIYTRLSDVFEHDWNLSN